MKSKLTTVLFCLASPLICIAALIAAIYISIVELKEDEKQFERYGRHE